MSDIVSRTSTIRPVPDGPSVRRHQAVQSQFRESLAELGKLNECPGSGVQSSSAVPLARSTSILLQTHPLPSLAINGSGIGIGGLMSEIQLAGTTL